MPYRIRQQLLFILAALTALVIWAICLRRSYQAHEAEVVGRRFSTVAVSLLHYSEYHGHLPRPVIRQPEPQSPDGASLERTGQPLHSWRAEIIPYLEAWHGHWDRSRPWNDPANEQLSELSAFYSSDLALPREQPKQTITDTNVLAITGPGTAFGDETESPKALKDVPPQTIIATETRVSGVPWPAPGDFDIRSMPHTVNAPDGKGVSGTYASGFHAIFADGHVWFLSNKLPFGTLKEFFVVEDAKRQDREKALGHFALRKTPD